MYITVRTIISNGGEIDTAVKVYYNYEAAKTNLMMQKDILLLELLIKYTKGATTEQLNNFDISKYGTLTTKETLLEFVEDTGDYTIRYEIKIPENYKHEEKAKRAIKDYGLGAF